MTEQYISGYLDAISRVKDMITPNMGGTNKFFKIPKENHHPLLDNIKNYLFKHREWYTKYHDSLPEILNHLKLIEIENWKDNLQTLIAEWTCDEMLKSTIGDHGYSFSEYLIRFLLSELFQNQEVKVFKMMPNHIIWHWGDHVSEEYVFETEDSIFIMHFGEIS